MNILLPNDSQMNFESWLTADFVDSSAVFQP